MPKQNLVHHGDILACVQKVYGNNVKLVKYEVEPATSSVQGFTSLMLRVVAVIEINGAINNVHIVIKRTHDLKQLEEITSTFNLFHNEVMFFTKVVPKLKCNYIIPVPECYFAYDTTVLMEDLSLLGYNVFHKDAKEIIKKELPISYALLVVRKLAQLHAASITKGIDWGTLLEANEFKDGFDNSVFKTMVFNGCISILGMLKELYQYEKVEKIIKWFEDAEQCYQLLLKLAQPVKNDINVITHGDCWMNNLMFKIDVDVGPIDVKCVDFQMFRFTHPSRDLLYFLFISFSREYREKFEKTLIEAYVYAFNAYACRTPDMLTYESFLEQYNNAKIFGALFATFCRPLFEKGGVFPSEAETEMTKNSVEAIFNNNHCQDIVKELQTNKHFKIFCMDITDELINTMVSANIVK